ncbi:MAG: sugar ABC transporter substrate-binding protein [Firmicutes bacterium]|nr:sugar ABC transporter substrate-binding protein [Bacillota bacterium]
MKSRQLRIVLSCLFLLAVLACPVVFAEKVVTIKYAFWGNPAAIGVEEEIINEFNSTHPGIKVEPVVTGYPDYHPKIMTMIAGGQAPDVMRIDSQFLVNFVKAGALMPIDSLIKRDKINLNLYYKIGLPESTWKGKMYGLPWGTAPIYLIYNIKMFKDAGVELPKEGWTWQDFVKAATAIAGGEGANRRYGYGHNELDIFTGILPFVWAAGGDVFDSRRTKFTFDNPRVLKRLDEIATLVKNKVFADPFEMTSADVVTRWFANNRIAMRLGAAVDILTLQGIEGVDFGVIHFPCGTTTKTTIVKSNTVAISATTKYPEEAWVFLKFLRAPGGRGDVLYSKAKRVPPAADLPELWNLYVDSTKPPKNIQEVTQAISAKYGRILPLRAGWTEIQGILKPALQKIWAGQASAAQAIKEVKPRILEVLSREG